MDRRSLRSRKVSERIGVLDEADQREALAARLEALEEDRIQPDAVAGASDDEEFVYADSDEEGTEDPASKKAKRKSGGSVRRTRGMIAEQARAPKTFADWLEESGLLPQQARGKAASVAAAARVAAPSYVTALAKYTCTRCASRYCSRRCNTTHTETRCLKFIA
ncbi:hypothetical protein QBZ16_002796 [Prototheca wickerhamii]|uniref:HIT-type domain-containing protein n=1 Tax=Prototheca wickerhamii TaxID=3111 RepID=A0AAD9IK21_PROWI|nr:hypothetical protein QBZ16_002796 [Prototheca wickerhamii]